MDKEVANEEVAEEEETITLGISKYQAIQKKLEDIQFEITSQRRKAREDKLLADEQFEAQQVLL